MFVHYDIQLCGFKDLRLYLYTLIIGHKSCNTLSKLNNLTLQNCVTYNVFLDEKVKPQQQQQQPQK